MGVKRREELLRTSPLLLAGAVAFTAAAGGLTNILDEPAFEMLLHVMIFLGVLSSALITGSVSTIVGLCIIAVSVAALSQRMALIGPLQLLYPPEVVADEDLVWATLWAWLMVGFSFMLGKRTNILFPLVAALAIFGLVATVNLNTVMLINFAIFIFSVVFIWGYEHLLNVGEQLPNAVRDGPGWLSIARTQALAGSLLVAVLLAVGLTVGTILYLLGPRLYVGPGGFGQYARYLQRSLLTYGGMTGSFQVGRGPVNLPATPAISVQSSRPALWRGGAYDFYTGSGWRREATGTQRLLQGENGWWMVPGAEELVGERNEQIVTLLNMESRALYAAAAPAMIRMDPYDRQSMVRYRPGLDAYGTLNTQYMMVAGASYEVVSIMPPTDAAILRATSQEYPPRITEMYIDQMQVQAEVELGPLVTELTADLETPYDKVVAIRSFLGETCLYTTQAPAVPAGEDAAVHFVQSGQRGACDLFATSMAVMARLAGVPARVATGFQTGTYDAETGSFVALQRDAHAWAEIYFPEIGWVPWDVSAAGTDDVDDIAALLRSERWRRELRDALSAIGNVLLVLLAAAALVSALLGPGILLRWLRSRIRRRTSRERLGEAFDRFRRRAARLSGVRLDRTRTAAEVQHAILAEGVEAGAPVHERLATFTSRFYDRRYGPNEPTDADIDEVRAEARRLLRELRNRPRKPRKRGGK